MHRARMELASVLSGDITVIGDAVPSDPPFGMLVREYNKYLRAPRGAVDRLPVIGMTARRRSWLFDAAFFGGSVPIVLLAPVAALFGTRALRGGSCSGRAITASARAGSPGIRVVVTGTIPTTPALYAGKHQAMFETFEMVALLDAPVDRPEEGTGGDPGLGLGGAALRHDRGRPRRIVGRAAPDDARRRGRRGDRAVGGDLSRGHARAARRDAAAETRLRRRCTAR